MTDRQTPRLDIYWVNQYAVPPDQPGGTRHYDFALALQARGHSVRLVASDLSLTTRRYSRRRSTLDPRSINETINGVRFIWLPAGAYHSNDWRRIASMLIFGIAAFSRLVVVNVRRGHTVFIGSSPHLFAALGTWLAAAIRRVPFVLEVRDLWPESYTEVSGKERGPEIVVMRRIADFLYRRARRIVVLAEASAEKIAERDVDSSKIRYVPNGVDLDRLFDGLGPVLDLSTPDRFTYVYAGAHGPANDLETVIKACAILEAEGRHDIVVRLIGDGPAKPSLKRLAETLGVSNVEFLEPIPKKSIGQVLRTADAALMVLAPAELFSYGVSPNKLYDYLAVGLPVVANVPGLVSGILETSKTGLSVPPGDPAALAAGMKVLVDSPGAVAAENGPRYVRENNERRALAQRIEGLLFELLPHSARHEDQIP